jgi:hypothetical protein
MISSIENKIFTSLQISESQLLTEMALLLAKQQLSKYSMEIDYFEKNTAKTFMTLIWLLNHKKYHMKWKMIG